jgi:hypothetical protein
MTKSESDEKIKNCPTKKINKCKNGRTSPISILSTFSIKNPGIKANPTNPSFESTSKNKKENLWDGNK